MTRKAKVYVPSDKEKSDTVVSAVKERLARDYGGFSAYDVNGGWVNDNDELIQDNITVVESVGDIRKEKIEDICKSVKRILNEDSVMYEIHNTNVGYVE